MLRAKITDYYGASGDINAGLRPITEDSTGSRSGHLSISHKAAFSASSLQSSFKSAAECLDLLELSAISRMSFRYCLTQIERALIAALQSSTLPVQARRTSSSWMNATFWLTTSSLQRASRTLRPHFPNSVSESNKRYRYPASVFQKWGRRHAAKTRCR
jgi:hypothetical protein